MKKLKEGKQLGTAGQTHRGLTATPDPRSQENEVLPLPKKPSRCRAGASQAHSGCWAQSREVGCRGTEERKDEEEKQTLDKLKIGVESAE